MRSLRSWPSTLPTPSAIISPFSSSIHRTGAVKNISSDACKSKAALTCGSMSGNLPHSKSNCPPYFFGMFSISMKDESVGRTSLSERIKILDVVIGSNHFLIHPQTVGKKEGAPIIYNVVISFDSLSRDKGTYKNAVQSFGVMCCCQLACVLHVAT